MEKLRKLRIALMLILIIGGLSTAMAQNYVSTPAGDLYLNLRNVTSPTADVASEDPDLVTKGTKVPYLVLPDAVLNSGWSAGTDATNTTGINSTWTWTIPGTIGTLTALPSNTGHYINIDVTGNANTTGIINVKEQGNGTCPDVTGTNMNVKIVAQPNATALSVTDGSAPLTSICSNGTNGLLNVALPTFNLTSVIDASIPGANKVVKIKASLSFTNFTTGATITLVPVGTILNVDASGNVSNADLTAAATANGQSYSALNSWGTYTLTVAKISDKISRKDLNAAVAGYFDVNGGTALTATYSVMKTAATGKIYHLSNN
jgi:hypothetical protein